MQDKEAKIVVIFGVFDMLHPGHVYFIESALEYGQNLNISLATDKYVLGHKSKNTQNNYTAREKALISRFPGITVYPGDDELGKWSILKDVVPNLIVFGHDQELLKNAVIKSGLATSVEMITIPAYNSEIYSTTNLTK
jgi:FAD synthetase